MALFGWGRPKEQAPSKEALVAVGDIFDPIGILEALDKFVPRYLDMVDRDELVYPACKRTLTDVDGSVRAIWDHTRIEAMRYIMMVPRREFELLTSPARQVEMLDAFLRQQPHEETVVDFTGIPISDLVIATIAGLNWLNLCAFAAGVSPSKFSGTLRHFRKIVTVAHQWWALDGAGERCYAMLAAKKRPPLMLYLIWSEYTRLAKEIATASIYGSSIDGAVESDRERLEKEYADNPAELKVALAALSETTMRLKGAEDPQDLVFELL
jgi:hypothetical protein